MRKLKSILRSSNRILKIWESENKLRGEVYTDGSKKWVQAGDFFDKEKDEFRVIEYFGFTNYCRVPFERRGKKIVLYPVNKQKRIIWTNNDYDEWKEALLADGEEEESLTYERYYEDCAVFIDDECCNLNKEVDGYIVAFADLGLWNGKHKASKLVGNNVRDILVQLNDYDTIFCDPFNVRHESIHHDGTNRILYRVAKDRVQAEKLAQKIAFGDMNEEQFRRATKSLRPYVARVYGW